MERRVGNVLHMHKYPAEVPLLTLSLDSLPVTMYREEKQRLGALQSTTFSSPWPAGDQGMDCGPSAVHSPSMHTDVTALTAAPRLCWGHSEFPFEAATAPGQPTELCPCPVGKGCV